MIDQDRLQRLLTPGAELMAHPNRKSSEVAKIKESASESPEYYIVVSKVENYVVCKENLIYASKTSATISKFLPDDILLFYISKIGRFAGIYKVVDKPYKAKKNYFKSPFFSFYVNIEPIIQLNQENWVSLEDVKMHIKIIKDKEKPAGLYMQNAIRKLCKDDFDFIKSKMLK